MLASDLNAIQRLMGLVLPHHSRMGGRPPRCRFLLLRNCRIHEPRRRNGPMAIYPELAVAV